MLPSAARASRPTAPLSIVIFSALAIVRTWSAMAAAPMVRNSKTCDRDRIVSGILASSVVAIMKTT